MSEPSDEILRQWLLRSLPPAEAEALEQRLLEDDALADRLRAAETDLLDDFARGAIGDRERAIAAERFAATPQDRARVRIAVALARARLASDRAPRRDAHAPVRRGSVRRFGVRRTAIVGFFAAACAVAVAVIGLDWRSVSYRGAAARAATLTLLANRSRGIDDTPLRIPQGATSLRLQAEVDAADPAVRYVLDIASAGKTVFEAKGLAAREAGPYRFVEVVVPARDLPAGVGVARVTADDPARTSSSWSIEAPAK